MPVLTVRVKFLAMPSAYLLSDPRDTGAFTCEAISRLLLFCGWFTRAGLAAFALWHAQIALALDPNSTLSQYAHRSWRVVDGAISAAPHAIAQTADGYLWIGSERGLSRFDGVRFVDWVPPDSHRLALKVFNLAASRDGSLWIGSDSGLFRWRGETLTHIGKLTASVFSLQVDRDDVVWATFTDISPQRLCRVAGSDLECNVTPGVSLRSGDCCAQVLLAQSKSSLWVGSEGTLFHWTPEATTVYLPTAAAEIRNNLGVSGFAVTGSGEQWVGVAANGREGGLLRLQAGELSPLVTEHFDTSQWIVNALFVDRNDVLWVGTPSGLYRLAGASIDRMSESSGLTGDNVLKIVEDAEGNIWVATARGLDQFRNLKVVTVGDDMDSVLARRDGSIWASTATGLRVLRDGVWSSVDQRHGLPGSQATSLLEDRDGRLWVGVEQGLTVYDGAAFRPIAGRDGRPIGMVVGMAEDRDGALWVAVTGNERKVLRIVDGHVDREFRAPAFPVVRRLAADPKGGIWLGGIDGNLTLFRDGELTVFPVDRDPSVPDSMLLNMIEQIRVLHDGTVAAASASGYIESRNGKQIRMSVANGLPCTSVQSFLEDARGDLWLYTTCNLVRIAREELDLWRHKPNRKVRAAVLDALDGAHPGWAAFSPKAVRGADGRLWFANSLGLQMLNPAAIHRNEFAPPVRIEAVVADRLERDLEAPIRLPALTRDVRIDYTAMSFSVPQKVRFRYRLEGYDTDWQDAGARRQAFFSNLSPGDYRFQVTACNEDDVCNPSAAQLPVVLLPAFHQTGWFTALVVAIAVALIAIAFNWRLSQLTSRLRARLEERVTERERIARELHDTFLQSVQGLILKFQSIMEMLPGDEPARRRMGEALDRADHVLREGRQRVSDLRESAEGPVDFPGALRTLAERLIHRDEHSIRVEVDGVCRRLHPVVSEELQGIVREAVTNAVRHARAKSIEIKVVYTRPALMVVVSDDGKGFHASQASGREQGHWGLTGMVERAEKIRARIEVCSGSGAGTVVRMLVPARIAFRRQNMGRRWFAPASTLE